MSKDSIYTTFTSKSTVNTMQLEELAKFLIANRSFALPPDRIKAIMTIRTPLSTPLGFVYDRAVELDKDKIISLIDVPTSQGISTPEVFTFRHMTFDVKQMEHIIPNYYRAMAVLPFGDRIVINVTPLLRERGDFADLLGFQSIVVRDLLSRSYYISDRTWLSPALAQYLCKVYSMSVSRALGSFYNLSIYETQTVATIFGLFFLSKTSGIEGAEIILRSNGKTLGIGSAQETQDIINVAREVLGPAYETMTLDDACLVLKSINIARLTTNPVNRKVLYTRLISLGPDIPTTALALEYPPYWAYLVLLAASGRKIGLAYQIKQGDNLKNAILFANDLAKSPGFLGII